MKLYNALIKKNKEGKISEVILIKEGFSFFAFLFSAFWFLYHKMYKEFLVLIAVDILFSFYANISSESDKILLQIAFVFIVALNANYWFCEHLKKKGYEFGGLFFGSSSEEAKLRFFDKYGDEFFSEEIYKLKEGQA
jgi:hypothetical protein